MADLAKLADQAAEELLKAIRDRARKASDGQLREFVDAYSHVVSTVQLIHPDMADLAKLADETAEELLKAIRDRARKASDGQLRELVDAYSIVASSVPGGVTPGPLPPIIPPQDLTPGQDLGGSSGDLPPNTVTPVGVEDAPVPCCSEKPRATG